MIPTADQEAGHARRRLEPLSCDTHFHVFDSTRFTYAPGRSYTPADATLETYAALCSKHGITRAILVHPSVYGSDHSSFEDALNSATPGLELRGVAVAYPDTPEHDLERWHALGTRGTRINALFAGGPQAVAIERVIDKVRSLGWHVQLLIDIVEQPELATRIADLGVTVVVDHMGHHDATRLRASKGFANLLALMAQGRAWTKLSGPYRLSADPNGAAVRQVVDALVNASPKQLVWGTDWPHPSSPHRVPSDEELIDALFNWLPDATLRGRVLVDNPHRLYWADSTRIRAPNLKET
jgi:2-pyrone-4,6-dicarboxylate lactonase